MVRSFEQPVVQIRGEKRSRMERMKGIINTGRKNERGASAIEFAIVLPVLILLLFGIIEFGVLLFDKAVLTNASREGARAGIAFQDPPRMSRAEIESVVHEYCRGQLITFSGTALDPVVTTDPIDPSLITRGESLTVNVSYQYSFLLLPNFVTSLSSGINLTATTVMRAE
jgi:Flp pilus assembly protein TadG